MSNLAPDLNPSRAYQEIGTVRRMDDKSVFVTTTSGELCCRRAVSCLVSPLVGDTVLIAANETGQAWLLAVLERDSKHKTSLSVDGDLDVQLRSGKFTVAAQEGIGMVSGADVSVVSGRFNLNAVDASVALQSLTYVGRFLRGEIEKVRLAAGTLDSVLDRFSQRVKRSYRTVEEIDQVRTQQLDYKADRNLSLRGGNTLVTAERLVKLDGDQIHLG